MVPVLRGKCVRPREHRLSRLANFFRAQIDNLKGFLRIFDYSYPNPSLSGIIDPISAPERQNPIKSDYNHASTPRSARLLALLPTEVLDRITAFLEKEDLETLRTTHRVFRHSAQAYFFRHVQLYNFRNSRKKPSGVDQLLYLLEEDERLRGYVQEITVGSLLDPTVEGQIKRLLLKVLRLLKPRKVVLAFRLAKGFTEGTQTKSAVMLREIFREFNIEDLTIQCDEASAPMFITLGELNVTTVVLTHRPDPYIYDSLLIMEEQWRALAIPSIRRLDLSLWQFGSHFLAELLICLPNLTELSIFERRCAPNPILFDCLRSKQHSLRELSLRRIQQNVWGQWQPETFDLSSFTALKKLVLDSTYLFPSLACANAPRYGYIPLEDPGSFTEAPEFPWSVTDLLPAQLKSLFIIFQIPQSQFKLAPRAEGAGSVTSAQVMRNKDYGWMMDMVQEKCDLTEFVQLVEELHICEGGGIQHPTSQFVLD